MNARETRLEAETENIIVDQLRGTPLGRTVKKLRLCCRRTQKRGGGTSSVFGVECDIMVNIKRIVFRFIHTIKLTLRILWKGQTLSFSLSVKRYEIERSGWPGVGVPRERRS